MLHGPIKKPLYRLKFFTESFLQIENPCFKGTSDHTHGTTTVDQMTVDRTTHDCYDTCSSNCACNNTYRFVIVSLFKPLF